MSLGSGNLLLAAGGDTGYNLTRSLRFRKSAGANLSRTLAASGNTKTWTVRFLLKRVELGTSQYLYGSLPNGSNDEYIYFDANNKLNYEFYSSGVLQAQFITSKVYRDPSAFYDIQLAKDNNQATASNRIKVYDNGVQITAFDTVTYPSSSSTGYINDNTAPQKIGTLGATGSGYFDGYLCEFYFIDGQQLTPSSFGSTNTLTGVWQPARYTGTYGTNGFYLPFTDNSALTTSSNVGLGKDFSGNGNYWTTNNISITAGTTYDSMTDVPTLTSATASNFAVLNPLDKNSSLTVSGGNLNAISDATTNWRSGAMTFGNFITGKWYYEITANSIGASTYVSAGWELTSLNHTSQVSGVGAAVGNNFGVLINNSLRQTKVNGSTFSSDANANANGDVLMVAVDFDAGKGWVGKNGTWYDSGNPSAGTSPCTTTVSGGMTPAYQAYNAGSLSFNAGQRPFAYPPPTGFVALNTYNLPDSTILAGNKVMDATLWSGTGANQNIVNAAAFKPDFVWGKLRNGADQNFLVNSVVGATNYLVSNSTNPEVSDATTVVSLNSNGFTVGTSTNLNRSGGYNFVGWQWQAGQGSTSSNTSGSITSTVSVNASAGFSVVTYTGNLTAAGTATVGHGLGVAPSLIISKSRSNLGDWAVHHTSLTTPSYYLQLNTTNAQSDTSVYGTVAAPTSSVFTTNYVTGYNVSGQTQVAYCWTTIAGYSAFGSLTGNGSADGPFVYVGFKPRFILVKRTDSISDWVIKDTARDPYNTMSTYLYPNASSAEGSGAYLIDCLSNGFKIRDSFGSWNASGGTYIYAAFASNPFRNSLAQ